MEPRYRNALPQLSSPTPFLSDGGIETTLIFKHGFDLPLFAAFPLLDTHHGRRALRDTYIAYVQVALRHGTGIVLETPTWRASRPWMERLGYYPAAAKVAQSSCDAVTLLEAIRREHETPATPIVISGALGPLGDAYKNAAETTVDVARAGFFHQVKALAESGVDMLSIMTITDTKEAIAAVQLGHEFGLPIMVSFSVETDGSLLNGRSLTDAMTEVDEATDHYAAYIGVNCAHPSHFTSALKEMDPKLLQRLNVIRANGSTKSHEELDNSETLDRGDPADLANHYAELQKFLPRLLVLGGCCGTDEEHIQAIASKTIGAGDSVRR